MVESAKKSREVFTLLNVAKIIGWFIVVGVSLYALMQSNKSIDLANQALIIGKRPHLSVKLIKFNETGKYFLAKEVDQGISVKVRFEIINTGNSTAKNIKMSDIYVLSSELISPNIIYKNEIKVDKQGSPTLV